MFSRMSPLAAALLYQLCPSSFDEKTRWKRAENDDEREAFLQLETHGYVQQVAGHYRITNAGLAAKEEAETILINA